MQIKIKIKEHVYTVKIFNLEKEELLKHSEKL